MPTYSVTVTVKTATKLLLGLSDPSFRLLINPIECTIAIILTSQIESDVRR